MECRWDSALGRRIVLVTLLAAAAGALLLQPAAAHAKRGITLGFSEPRFMSTDASVRDYWFNKAGQSGGDWARIGVGWRGIAPNEPTNPVNPSSAGYFWGGPDAAVRSAAEHDMQVVLTITSAPDWAEGAGAPAGVTDGTWKPNPSKLADFATAVAKRYSGSYPDPLHPGQTLPKVSRFEIWNESNLSTYLMPQNENGKYVAADIYRNMVNAAYPAIHAVQPTAQVIVGALSPIGSVPGGNGPRVGPLTFLKRLFCVKGNKKLKTYKCGNKIKLDVLSHHPINVNRAPLAPAGRQDAGIAEMPEVIDILRTAEKGGIVATKGKHPVWATEFWWHSKPPKTGPDIPNLKKQAQYVEQGLYLLWKDKVDVALLYQVGDEKGSPFQTGILFENGKPKPAQTAYRFPLVGDRKSKRKVLVWGRAPSKGKVKIQVKGRKGGFKTKSRIRVKPESVFKTTVKLKGKGKIRAKLGRDKSLSWSQKR